MKEIKTDSFKKMADQNVYPPVPGEDDGSKLPRKKGWKYMPQLGKWIPDVKVDIEV